MTKEELLIEIYSKIQQLVVLGQQYETAGGDDQLVEAINGSASGIAQFIEVQLGKVVAGDAVVRTAFTAALASKG